MSLTVTPCSQHVGYVLKIESRHVSQFPNIANNDSIYTTPEISQTESHFDRAHLLENLFLTNAILRKGYN